MSFEDLGLGPEIVRAVTERGYTVPTPIQAQAIPHILMMRDVVGLAQTGTGKTAGFTLPMIEILGGGRAKARMPRSLILSPTRELAAQIAEQFDIYGKYHKLSKALLVGGESMGEQVKLLERGVDVLIATPGRLLDLFERGNILLNDIKILVIDEADRMLDMGFIPDIEKIVSKVPPQRQTLLFSATMPPEINRLAAKFLSNPRQVSVAPPASPALTVKQSLVWVKPRDKRYVLQKLLQAEDVKNAFIFCNRKIEVDALVKWLVQNKLPAAGMHGDMAQSVRNQTLADFKSGKVVLLVCSDVAARGLDVAGVSHVFNYDPPMHPDDYVHRIGRTGRAGMQGRAWMLATPDDDKYINQIESLIKRKIDVEEIEGFGKPSAEDGESDRGGKGGNDRSRSGQNSNGGRNNDRRPPRREETKAAPAPREERAPREDRPVRQEQPRSTSHDRSKPVPRPAPRRDDARDDGPNSFGDDLPGFLKR
jgi:superfamily II DNA/RNA helicase